MDSEMIVCGMILSPKSYSKYVLQCVKCGEAKFDKLIHLFEHLLLSHPNQLPVENVPLPIEILKTEHMVESDDLPHNWKHNINEKELEENNAVSIIQTASKNEIAEVSISQAASKIEILVMDDVNEEEGSENDYELDYLESEEEILDNLPKPESSKHTQFHFNLNDVHLHDISLEYLDYLRNNTLAWNTNLPRLRYMLSQRKILIINLQSLLLQKGYTTQEYQLRRIIKKTVDTFIEAVGKVPDDMDKVDADSKYLLELCSFMHDALDTKMEMKLRKLIQIDEDADGLEGDAQKSVNPEDVCTELKSKKSWFKICRNRKRIFKQIRFHFENNPLANDFVDLLSQHPALYDPNHEDHYKTAERKQIFETWIPHFKQAYNLHFDYSEFSQNFQILLRYYHRIINKTELKQKVQEFRDKCSFLPTEQPTIYKCVHCERKYKSMENYNAHLFTAHSVGDKHPFQCEYCEQLLASIKSLKQHISTKHQEQVKIKCPQCHRCFGNRENLERHQKNHDEEEKAKRHSFICKTCGKKLSSPYHLATHENKHMNKRDFACHLCPKAFFTNGHLQDHLNSHLGIRKHKCEECGKGFHSNHALSRHRQTHESIRRYICKLCGSKFHQFVGLNSHLKNRHNTVPNTSNSIRIPKHEAYNQKDDTAATTELSVDNEEMDVEMLEEEFDV